MKRLLVLFLVACARLCCSQYNSLAPYVWQSQNSGADSQTPDSITLPHLPVVGHVIWGFETDTNGGTPVTISDVNGNVTLTMDSAQTFTTQTSPGGSITGYIRTFCGVVTSAGSHINLVTSTTIGTTTSASLVAAEFANATCTKDGSQQYSASPDVNSISQSYTNSINGDLIIAVGVAVNQSFGGAWHTGTYPLLFAAGTVNGPGANGDEVMFYTVQPPGTRSYTLNDYFSYACVVGPCHLDFGILVTALKPVSSGIVGATTQVHDACNGCVYSEQLMAVGGTTAPTFAVSSGSLSGTGLSLSSGGLLSGIVTAINDITISYTATDGSSTSSPQSITIHVGCGQNTPTVVSSVPNNTVISGWTISSGVQALDVIEVALQGPNSHYGSPYIEPTVEVSDTAGSTVYRVECAAPYILGATTSHYLLQVPAGFAGGGDTISFSFQGTGSPLGSAAIQLRGVQPLPDVCAYATAPAGSTSGTSLTTNSLTAPVANEFLRATAFGFNSTSLAVSSPFSTITSSNASAGSNTWQQVYSSQQLTSTGSYTATGTASAGAVAVSLFGLRPSSPSCTVVKHRTNYIDQNQ